MSARIVIEDADIVHMSDRSEWILKHPSNGAVLAYCDSREEAVAIREMINDMQRKLHDPDFRVIHLLTGKP